MKYLFSTFFSIFYLISYSQTYNSSVSKFNITKPTYNITINENIGSNLKLGDGINMSDLYNPEGTPLKAFNLSTLESFTFNEKEISTTKIDFGKVKSRVVELQTSEQLAEMIYANFKGSYNLANMSMAYNRAKTLDTNYKNIFVFIEITEFGPSISREEFSWIKEPLSEDSSIKNDDERLSQFLNDYGSHYIQSLTYGARIVIHAKLKKKYESDLITFKAEIEASFGAGSAGGSINTSTSKILNSGKVEISSEVIAGKISPNKYQTVMNSYEQVATFINGMRDGTISVSVAPIEAKLRSYWHTVLPYSNIRKILTPFSGYKINTPYGVPTGTIIAWSPDSKLDKKADIKAILPDGWALCDGTNNNPNLIDKFIMGTTSFKSVGIEGGSNKHSHSSNMGNSNHNIKRGNRGSDNKVAENDHSHSLTINESDNLPPFYKLIYIIKK